MWTIYIIFFNINQSISYLQSNTWTYFARMSTKRAYASSILLDSGDLWITGGKDFSIYFNTSELLTNSGQYQTSIDLPEELIEHTMVKVNTTLIAFIGNDPSTNRVYLFDTITNRFNELPNLKTARAAPQAGKFLQCLKKLIRRSLRKICHQKIFYLEVIQSFHFWKNIYWRFQSNFHNTNIYCPTHDIEILLTSRSFRLATFFFFFFLFV